MSQQESVSSSVSPRQSPDFWNNSIASDTSSSLELQVVDKVSPGITPGVSPGR